MHNIDPFLTLNEVKKMTTLSKSKIYQMISEGKFPLQVHLTARRVAWRASEIANFLENLPYRADL